MISKIGMCYGTMTLFANVIGTYYTKKVHDVSKLNIIGLFVDFETNRVLPSLVDHYNNQLYVLQLCFPNYMVITNALFLK